MATLRELVTKLAFKVDRTALKIAAKLMDNVGKSAEEVAKKTEKAERATRNMGKAIGVLQNAALGAAGVVLGLGTAFFGMSVKTAMAFEKMQAILTTTEGSEAAAKKAMAWVSNFASKTPYELEEVTQAFVRMRAYGLDPTNGSLSTLGDASSAMGKNVMQAVEMMADAVTGEFERLKEFGIKGNKKGGIATFQFTDKKGIQRTRKVLADDRKAIEKAILDIFAEKYTGAMERQSKTLEGILSNLRDQWTRFQQQVMASGAFDAIKQDLQAVLTEINKMAADGRLQAYAERVGKAFLTAYNTAKGAIKGLNDATRWIVDNRELVEAALVGITALVGGMGLSYGITTGALRTFVAGMVLATRAIWLNIAALAVHPATMWTVLIAAIVYGLIKLEQKTGIFSKALSKALEIGKKMYAFFTNLKIPDIKIGVKYDIPKLPKGSFLSATQQMNADRGGGATTTPPAGRAPARAGGGSGAGAKSFTNTANTTVNINGGGMTPSRARQLGQGFAQGSLNGFRSLEVFGS